MKRVCVFCASSDGRRAAYADAARAMAQTLVDRGIGLVYGGGSVGLMGVLADAVLAGGGEAIGVLPRGLARKEYAHPGLTELHLVGSMHERKAMMASLADGFVALPGGLGTLEEILEVFTWAQLGIHRKPLGLVDVEGYWAGLLALLRHAVQEGFVRPEYAALLLVESDPAALLDRFLAWRPPVTPPVWLDPTET
ncbi:MAG TPA: TIGR00730 family Rossman fold protein [Methylomirabilota bacterium]|nr:TIGR00730 family Rossman fold protein [Methylomirabilota bacterium]